jgi:hypothetical protein
VVEEVCSKFGRGWHSQHECHADGENDCR